MCLTHFANQLKILIYLIVTLILKRKTLTVFAFQSNMKLSEMPIFVFLSPMNSIHGIDTEYT
jgi:hypothetical protein